MDETVFTVIVKF